MMIGPIMRYQRGYTPYNFTMKNGGWHIGYGVSSFLIAQGSGFSAPIGRKLLKVLDSEYRRLPPPLKKRKCGKNA